MPGLCALRIDNAPQLRYTMGIESPGICGAEDPPQKRKKVSPLATEAKLRQLAEGGCPVYYFYSSERYLVRQAVAAAVRLLSADSDEEATVLDGAAPELEQLIMAAGTISFFGTRRVVVLPELDPAAYSDKDLDALCETLSSLENAVVVLGSVFPLERGKLKTGKRAQKLTAAC